MNSLWNDRDAARCRSELALRAYTSRLLGSDRSLVMYGGGNTSVKVRENNLFGEDEDILYVKGSGSDLAKAGEADFSPVRLAQVRRLIELDGLDSAQAIDQFTAAMKRAGAPRPSIETLLHAVLPFKYVEHTHADAVLAIANTAAGEGLVREAFGDSVLIVPYCHSGFELAKRCHEIFSSRATPATIGLVLMHHGVVAFGDTARESYERMIGLADRAERFMESRGAWGLPVVDAVPRAVRWDLANLRWEVSRAAGFPMILTHREDSATMAFVRRNDLAALSQRGPATPQHAIFTKRVPLLGRDVEGFARAYRDYVAAHLPPGMGDQAPDPAPRIVLDPDLGLCAAGITVHYANAAAEVYRHTIDIVSRAGALGGYRALPPGEVLAAELEYGGFERSLLARQDRPTELMGEVALVTDVLSGVGRACAAALMARGAAVVGLDRCEHAATLFSRPDYLGVGCDPDVPHGLANALERAVRTFGGLDMLVVGEGSLGAVDACRELLGLAPRGGRVAVVASGSAAGSVRPQGLRVNAVLNADAAPEAAAELAAEMCGPLFRATSGAAVPVSGAGLDGGML
jgi:rhamnose utilization protein RhaD (predicted bifunctional aldolase and dehydrogenase)